MTTFPEEVFVVEFQKTRDENGVMTYVNGRVAFPDRKNTDKPEAGQAWEVQIRAENPARTVYFLNLIKEVQVCKWQWSNQRRSRGRRPACLIITPDGKIHRFTGKNIPGVVHVVKSQYTKQGKWSYTNFHCTSPDGTKVHQWYQDWEDGLFWPQAYWNEVFQEVQETAPHSLVSEIEAVIRAEWPKAAKKFDENSQALLSFSSKDVGKPIEWQWSNQLGHRSRKPACLVISSDGKVHRFTGENIPGIVHVVKSQYTKQGKWSKTNYHCISPIGTTTRSWRQSWDEGLFWPETNWQEVIATMHQVAKHIDVQSLKKAIRAEWPKAAEKLDAAEN